ncbi:MAG: hypothetical protein Q8N79_07930, partial [Candidatus Methanoperedens sp.]|nr:hypothetical protein [Candidatus Methanoperedens sp.]
MEKILSLRFEKTYNGGRCSEDLMMVEKSGGRAKSRRMLTVQCTICGMDMDCPESMMNADRHICAQCADLLAKGYEPEELKMSPEDIAQH